MSSQNQNQMFVEDADTQGVVIGLMRKVLGNWGKNENEWPVNIVAVGNATEVLKDSGLVAGLQGSSVKVLGIVVDADDHPMGRWERIRSFCRSKSVTVDEDCPPDGLIVDGVLGRRFGAWIMPNNQDIGMVENFCRGLVPPSDSLWPFSQTCAEEAKKRGAPYIDAHRYKAEIHTWLAWQHPPGERMGRATSAGILRHDAEAAQPFIKWFRNLYGV